jgi:Mg2+-importing ATPase
VDKKELRSPQRYNIKDVVLLAVVLGIVSTVFDFIFFGLFFRISEGVLQTNWFIGSILTELVFLFSIRSKGFFLKSKAPSGILFGLTSAAFLTTIIIPFTTFGQKVFGFIKPSVYHLTLILSIVIVYFVCSEIVKLLYYKNIGNSLVKV